MTKKRDSAREITLDLGSFRIDMPNEAQSKVLHPFDVNFHKFLYHLWWILYAECRAGERGMVGDDKLKPQILSRNKISGVERDQWFIGDF